MARPKGSRTVLVRITYDTIGELAGGMAGNTARQYARRGEYDSRNIESVIYWVNARRTAQRLPPIGLVTDSASKAHSDDDAPRPVNDTPVEVSVLAGGLVYDPTIGEFRGLDDNCNR